MFHVQEVRGNRTLKMSLKSNIVVNATSGLNIEFSFEIVPATSHAT